MISDALPYAGTKKNFEMNGASIFINEKGVGTGIHYPITLYNQPVYRKHDIEGDCPNAELAAKNVISLPVHPSLTKEDLDLVIEAVKYASSQI